MPGVKSASPYLHCVNTRRRDNQQLSDVCKRRRAEEAQRARELAAELESRYHCSIEVPYAPASELQGFGYIIGVIGTGIVGGPGGDFMDWLVWRHRSLRRDIDLLPHPRRG